ncbi:hypothetical protein RYZ26_19230 [Terasakiella sp. A23]|uniref:hypothetical protein n=1 Tax=Terasakiella sp. FCG-A23 TaxID=3080561 RepID=UPI002955A74F|nr:hypothetical protein [Terasakiella sp. A23]MDV7341742.1 hypothetical protein [Terasakiella sp. A23]
MTFLKKHMITLFFAKTVLTLIFLNVAMEEPLVSSLQQFVQTHVIQFSDALEHAFFEFAEVKRP